MQQLWNRQRKQDNRWLRARVQSQDRGGITVPIERELVHWFHSPSKREQEKLELRPDLQLSAGAMLVWRRLKAERKAAKDAQGQNFEAEDWWLEVGDEGKKMKTREQMDELSSMMAILGIRRQEDVREDEEGNFVFASPEGSVVGVEEKEEVEDDEEEEEEEDTVGVA